MKHLPAFFDLAGRSVLVVGATDSAAQRARLARDAGADVVEAEDIDSSDLAARRPVIAFVATGDAARDGVVASALRAAGVPVNVVDRPALSDFIMPAIVDRGDVVVAVSTGGASPTLARHIRQIVERALPSRIGALAAFGARFRDTVKRAVERPDARRRLWERVIAGPIGQDVLAGRDGVAAAAMLRAINAPTAAPEGSIALVGAGPGDPELLTLRAARLLGEADVLLYDDLVDPAILDVARRDALRVGVGKRKGRPSMPQAEINTLIVEHARAGRRVVRLKGGDPFVFGRGGEERDHARAHGFDPVVVPGITAALGCGASAGIPLTHRDHASAITFVTAQRKPGDDAPDWAALARAGHTLAIYMGLTSARDVRDGLVAGGLSAATPVAVVQNGTRANQSVSCGTLSDLAALAARHPGDGPALIVVGAVAALADIPAGLLLAEAS